MSVLTRSALSASPLADLHLLASELGIDGFRRLRKPELVDRILERQNGESADGDANTDPSGAEAPPAPSRRARGGRGRRRDADPGSDDDNTAGGDRDSDRRDGDGDADGGPKPRSGREPQRPREERSAEGVVALQPGGAALVDSGDEQVYLSAAQVRRCELVDGDRVSGPIREARRSERHPSLIRVDTINGRPADEAAVGTPYDELPCEPPSVRFAIGAELLPAALPIGRGSRVTIAGPALSGKTELLRAIVAALRGAGGVEVAVVLCGSRPEETAAWREAGVEPAGLAPLPASSDARARVLEQAIDSGRRRAARGEHVVVAVDGLDGLDRSAARRALGAARNLTGGGSLTVIATAAAPAGGETTQIVLGAGSAAARPAIDEAASAAFRPDLLG